MNPRVKAVEPIIDFRLKLTFNNDEKRVFDVKPYLNFGVFQELKDISNFYSVKPFNGTVMWNNEIDFCPDTLYLESTTI